MGMKRKTANKKTPKEERQLRHYAKAGCLVLILSAKI